MAATAAINNFHNSIRTLAQTKRIRVTEFFQDFDKLRSGFVTGIFRFNSVEYQASLPIPDSLQHTSKIFNSIKLKF